ncbi:retropepsin-like aspartic protease family protein [Paracoccus pacificus]|uniref:TIGR02281 family clan AA aspartic protease n=1 Tax=Paracoccus pacificus TaxID=1463598 RepID=A0ABW4R937_9RHOB
MSDLWMNVAYFALLLIAVGGFLVVEMRTRPGQTIRQALAWLLIFLGVIAAAGLWDQISNTVSPRQITLEGGRVEIPQGNDGHYRLTADLNGQPVTFIVDTGASTIVLSHADARRIGIEPDDLAYYGTAMTANGAVPTAQVTIARLTLGDISDTNVPAVVTQGELGQSLLGMSFLSRFVRVSIDNGVMVIER